MQAECFPKQFKTEIEKLGGWPIQARFWLEWAYSNLWSDPHGSKKGSRFESYREAWRLLAPNLKELRERRPI
jgi:hypothetical protein